MNNTFIGIDISKETLDFYVKNSESESHYQIDNEVKSIKKFFKKFNNSSEIIVTMENTGRYNFLLYEVLSTLELSVFVINSLHLKRSIGLTRGKNDKIDSQRICLYIEKNYMDLQKWKPSSTIISKISYLNTERRFRIKIKSSLQKQLKDIRHLKNCLDKEILEMNKRLIKNLDNHIKKIEDKIVKLINSDQNLNDQYKRIQTIPGVGKVLATLMIIKTNGFTEILSARKMACFAGIAPFEHRSGSSIYYRARVSTMADKELKKTLHLAALSTIRLENDLAIYYHRKVEEGKNKMSVLNAVRNKIIHRIYALIKNETVYNFNLEMS